MAVVERYKLEPVPSFRYTIEIDGIPNGWFTECAGLTVERTIYPYPEGGLNAYEHQLPDRIQHTHITLKHGIADSTLWAWLVGQGEHGLYEARVEPRNVAVILYNVDRSEAQRWNIVHAYPVKWTGPAFKAGDSAIALETLEIAQGSGARASAQRATVGGASELANSSGRQPTGDEIDLPALAARVYKMLQEEARIERQRLGRHTRR